MQSIERNIILGFENTTPPMSLCECANWGKQYPVKGNNP